MSGFFNKNSKDAASNPSENRPLSSRLYNSFSITATARSAASAASSVASVAASSAASVAASVASSASAAASSSTPSQNFVASQSASSLTSLSISSSNMIPSNVGAIPKKDKDEFIENDLYVEYLKELRMNYEFAGEKVAIFDKFYSLLEPGTLHLPLEAFVIDSKKKGHSVQWSDAAFRAVDIEKRGEINKFEYLFAVISLQTDERFLKNPRWLELRRKLVFTYYDRGEKGYMNNDDFIDLVRDASVVADEPEAIGIANKKWSSSMAILMQNGGHDVVTLGQDLAVAKLELVQKQSELAELHMAYIQLEKKYCAMKLELAATKELIDNQDT